MSTAAVEWELWSTTARLVVTEPRALNEARAICDDILQAVENACSRFRPDSELQRIAPGLEAGVLVSDLLASLVDRALFAAARTDGDVDPTVGTALGALGYDRDLRLIEDSDGPLKAVVSVTPGWRLVSLREGILTVPAGLSLDLGATAKAVAADLAAERIAGDLGCGVLVSLGGDIASAGSAPPGGWSVLVQDTPSDPATTVTLSAGFALATSSTQRRRWRRAGHELHHILDPRTGRPASEFWRTVTIAAPSCFEANTLSTAAIIRAERAIALLSDAGVAARLVGRDGAVTRVGGWPAESSESAASSEPDDAASAAHARGAS